VRLRPVYWYCAIASAVAAPLLGGGYLLLLDFVVVRNVPVEWWPSPANQGPFNAAPTAAILWLLSRLGWAAGPTIIFALFAGMGLAAHKATVELLRPRRQVASFFAGTLYVINPFTYERLIHGHIQFLAAYAILPLALLTFRDFLAEPRLKSAAAFGATVLGIVWTSIQMTAMLPLPLILLAVFCSGPSSRKAFLWGSAVLAGLAVINLWWIIGAFAASPGAAIGSADLALYATQPRSNGVIGNVAALYGFWRTEFRLPKNGVQGWWVILIPMGLLVATGFIAMLKTTRLRGLAWALAISMFVSLILACGISFAPAAGVFRWTIGNVPGFKIFRESQKWAAILALGYAILGAAGLDLALAPGKGLPATSSSRRVTALVGIIAVLLPIAYAWTLVWNHGRLTPVRFPSDWAAVDRVVSKQPDRMLFLPWHLYISLSFTRRRVVNPAPYYFSVPVVSGDGVEAGGIRTQSTNPESRDIERALFTPEGRSAFADALIRRCIGWVVLARESDYRGYAWIEGTRGIEQVLDRPRMRLWRVTDLPGHCLLDRPTRPS
jgi:hypothetical protein